VAPGTRHAPLPLTYANGYRKINYYKRAISMKWLCELLQLRGLPLPDVDPGRVYKNTYIDPIREDDERQGFDPRTMERKQ
jgi:hypothetical protein